MEETDLINKTLMFMYLNQHLPVHIGELTKYVGESDWNDDRILGRIYDIGFAIKKENRVRTMNQNHPIYDYWINSTAIHLIESTPDEYKDKTYSYYLKIENEKADLITNQIQSAIDTNKSSKALNLQTGTFYTKQTDFSKRQRNLTRVIAIATFVYTIVASLTYNDSRLQRQDTKEMKTEVGKLEQNLSNYHINDSIFHKSLMDSIAALRKKYLSLLRKVISCNIINWGVATPLFYLCYELCLPSGAKPPAASHFTFCPLAYASLTLSQRHNAKLF